MDANTQREIHQLIETWAAAVRNKDLDGVLADHTADVVMFDVPPPVRVAGIENYRDTWPAFFDWQRNANGTFEIATLDITAGDSVAFATALLRCGSRQQLEKDDTPRLRLTLGLRREAGRWKIAHEHHSFPLEPAA